MTTALLLLADAGLPERALFSALGQEGGLPIAPEVDALAPPIEQATLDGAMLRLSDLRGAPVIINFWATWCGPCRIEMPYLQRLYEANRERGLRILAVNMGERPEVVRAWVEQNRLTFDIIVDQQNVVAERYRLRGQPSTYVVAPDGVIRAVFFGPVSEDELRAAVAPYLPA